MLKFLVVLFAVVPVERAVVQLSNNGYEGITVAIHPNVDENHELVENIKALMTSASAVLYRATGQRAFFSEVTIIVPPSWSKVYETAISGGRRFGTAEIRIDLPNPEYGSNPYTLQPGGCGEPGLYIHLTPEFVLDLHGTITEEYGDPGKTLIHEWAHLRYGVFDEYGDLNDYRTPSFYLDEEGQVRVTGCTNEEVEGTMQTPDGQPCTDPQNCEFKVDIEGTTAKSSLMYLHFLPKVDGFCGMDPSRPHDHAAPTKHNLMCSGKSAWEVISSHPDFAEGRNPSRLGVDTTPNFRVLQAQLSDGGIYILLLDISGSMMGGRIEMLRRSAAQFITEQIPEGSQLGLVVFSTNPKVLANLTVVDKHSRRSLVEVLPKKDDGGHTGIGAALATALQILNVSKEIPEGSTINLITDGEENVPPYVRTVVPDLVATRVVVNTMAFGKWASSQLENLVKATGGRGFFYSDDDVDFPQHDNVLQSAFFTTTSTQADVDFRPVEILNKLEILESGQSVERSILIEDELRKNVRFVFGYAVPEHLSVVLIGPQGDSLSAEDDIFRNDPISKLFIFHLPMASAGKWTYQIENSADGIKQGVGVTVSAEPTDIKQHPIRIKAWMNDLVVRFPQDAANMKVFAQVSKSYQPILGALVIAAVERPMGSPVEVVLRDDGIGADAAKDDGIYTAYFAQFNGTGRYSVTARVINDGRAYVKGGEDGDLFVLPQGRSAALSKLAYWRMQRIHRPQLPPLPSNKHLGLFERTADAGSFRLIGWYEKDVIPPGRVTDLKAVQTGPNSVKLTWTSPGDDLDAGTASRLDLRYHRHARSFAVHFESGQLVTRDHLDAGTILTPASTGHIQEVVVRLASVKAGGLLFAVRIYDENDNSSPVSNLAFVRPLPSARPLPQRPSLLLFSFALMVVTVAALLAIFFTYRSYFGGRKGFYSIP